MQSVKMPSFCVKLIVVIFITLALSGCGMEKNDAQLVATAKTYLAAKKIRAATLELKNALQKNPRNGEARYLLGKINLDIGDYKTAQKEFRHATQSGWAKDKAQIGLAKSLMAQQEFQELLNNVSVSKKYPASSQANIYALYADAQIALGKLGQAQNNLKKAKAIDSKSLQVLIAQAHLQLARNKKQQASIFLNSALQQYPNSDQLLLLLAKTAIQNSDKKLARSAYNKIISLEPEKLVTVYGRAARFGLAKLNIADEKLDSAQALLKPLFEQNRNDPELNYISGLLAFKKGDLDAAKQSLLRVLKFIPDQPQSQLLLGMVNFEKKNFEQVVYYLSTYINANPENIDARKLLGRAYIQLGKNNEAEQIFQPDLKLHKKDAELLALAGITQLQKGNLEAGISGLKKAVNAAPDNAYFRISLAKAYIASGETKKATDELKMLVSDGKLKKQSELLLIISYLRAGNFEKAINSALSLLSNHADEPVYLALTGNVFLATKDKVEALKYFNKSLQIDPGFAPAKMALARMAEQTGDTEKAISLYKSMIGDGEKSVIPLVALARLAKKTGKNTEMLSWLEQARNNAPLNITPRRMLAEYYLRNRQAAKADIYIQEALNIQPQETDLLGLQARSLTAQGQYSKAIPVLHDLLEKAPGSIYFRSLLAEVFLKVGQNSDAQNQLQLILNKQPDYKPALALMVRQKINSGHLDQALIYSHKIQKIQPRNYLGYELAGDVLMMAKKYNQARISYDRALQYKASPTRLLKLAEASAGLGNSANVQKILATGLKKYPGNARILQSLGNSYLNNGRNDQAIASFEKLLASQQDNIVALNNLAWLYSLRSSSASLKKAMRFAEKAYNLKPENHAIQDTYGWLLVQTGQLEKGLSILKRAIKFMPSVPEVQYHYAAALMESGYSEEGKRRLRHLLKSTPAFEGRAHAVELLRK
ncbi:hypothetical protein MNBD_GAMMA24-2587 [hydrothermal vent metagenome]|uniref:Uncharacterized protein n=1 Tax=hydrothermal vent metagenome TaxID=652676 RepID=A0A3B1BM09_9ZZZZ